MLLAAPLRQKDLRMRMPEQIQNAFWPSYA